MEVPLYSTTVPKPLPQTTTGSAVRQSTIYKRFFPMAFFEAGLFIPNTAIPTREKQCHLY